MARVTIVLEDTVDGETGQQTVTCHLTEIDPQGRPQGSPRTGAEIAGIGIQRMWRARALPPMIMLACGDMTGLQARLRQGEDVAVQKATTRATNLAKGMTPDKTGATDVSGVEVQPPPQAAGGDATPGPA